MQAMPEPAGPRPEVDAGWREAPGPPEAGVQSNFALDAAAGVGAAGFAALVLWTLPAFMGLPGSRGVVAVLVGATAVAYAIAGPHAGTRRMRAAVPLVGLAALLAFGLVRALVPGGLGAMAGYFANASAQAAGWGAGAVATLGTAAALPVTAAVGLLVGIPVFHAARVGRPAVALLLGFALLVVEWEFVDNATIRLFWPLVGVALFWLAADRARETGRAADVEVGSPTPWAAFGVAALAGAIVVLGLFVAPRQGGPANLGRVGVWIDHLPLIGTIEKATREGSLGYNGSGGAGPGSGSGPGGGGAAAVRSGGFSLAQTGFTPDTAHLGGPATPGTGAALQITIGGAGALPSVLYLRGAVRDIYTGSGWQADAQAETADPVWASVDAGDIGRAFLSGTKLPSYYDLVSARIQLQAAASANLFTALLPLQLPVQGVTWDAVGEVWAGAPLAPGFTYSITSAVLSPNVWNTTQLASYTAAGAPGALTPEQALARAEQHASVSALPLPADVHDLGALPLAQDLELPAALPRRVANLAHVWTQGLRGDPLLEALAIEQHLSTGYAYTLDAPAVPPGRDFVDFFLFTAGRGYCTSYSTAMVVLLRALGIPARWVEGYRVGLPPGGGSFVVRQEAAHAWVEAYIAPYGWLTFDPTPGQAPAAAAVARTTVAGAGGLGFLEQAPIRWWELLAVPAGVMLLLLGSAAGNLLSERAPGGGPVPEAQAVWRACERVGNRFGRPRHRAETPLEYAAELGARYPQAAASVQGLADEYGRVRYGPQQPPDLLADRMRRLHAHWQELQVRLRQAAPLTYPLRRWL